MSNTPNTDPTEPMDLETARRVEQAKISRRAALRKLGFGAGLAAFSMLGVDDFARMVGKRLERMAGDNKTASAVAKEFQQSGIALAAPTNPSGISCIPNNDCSGCSDIQIGDCCSGSSNPFACCGKSSNKSVCCAGVAGSAKYLNDPGANGDCNAYGTLPPAQ